VRKRTKFFLLRVSVMLAFTILAGKLWYVQVVMGSYYKQQGNTSKIRVEPVQALRGIIYDRQGRQLVYNAPSWNAMVVPNAIPPAQADEIYHHLAQLLGNKPSASDIAKIVSENTWQGYHPIIVKPNIAVNTALVIRMLHQELPGISAIPSSVRNYPIDPQFTLSHILGYTSVITQSQYNTDARLYPNEHVTPSDQIGVDGVEASMDPYLHGVNGSQSVEVDSGERPVRTLRQVPAVPGDSVYLTIDAHLQRQVAGDLGAALSRYHLHRGVAVVENVRTGEILAMASLPSYNGNWFSGGISAKHWKQVSSPPYPLDNFAIAGQFPPGSIYKMITAAAALQTGAANAGTVYNDTGVINLYGHIFHGWKPGGLGPENMVTAIAQSSDIYFYTVAGGNPNQGNVPHTGPWNIAKFARLFGLGSPTGIQLPGESAGLVPTPGWFKRAYPGYTWHIGDTYNMAIGQGQNLVTPLQMANVTAAVANGGTLYRPSIVERIVGRVEPRQHVLAHSQVLQPFVPSIIRRNFVDPANISLIQQGMHLGVDSNKPWYGTSWLVHDPRIDAAGKTGTAEDPHGTPDAWWTGYAPYNNPQIAVTVLVPNAGAEGSYFAAPIAHKILEDYFHVKPTLPDMPNDTHWLDDVQQIELPLSGQ
jgi:penicillin-binding protein 2